MSDHQSTVSRRLRSITVSQSGEDKGSTSRAHDSRIGELSGHIRTGTEPTRLTRTGLFAGVGGFGVFRRQSPARLLYRTFDETPVGDPAVDVFPEHPPGADSRIVATEQAVSSEQSTAGSLSTVPAADWQRQQASTDGSVSGSASATSGGHTITASRDQSTVSHQRHTPAEKPNDTTADRHYSLSSGHTTANGTRENSASTSQQESSSSGQQKRVGAGRIASTGHTGRFEQRVETTDLRPATSQRPPITAFEPHRRLGSHLPPTSQPNRSARTEPRQPATDEPTAERSGATAAAQSSTVGVGGSSMSTTDLALHDRGSAVVSRLPQSTATPTVSSWLASTATSRRDSSHLHAVKRSTMSARTIPAAKQSDQHDESVHSQPDAESRRLTTHRPTRGSNTATTATHPLQSAETRSATSQPVRWQSKSTASQPVRWQSKSTASQPVHWQSKSTASQPVHWQSKSTASQPPHRPPAPTDRPRPAVEHQSHNSMEPQPHQLSSTQSSVLSRRPPTGPRAETSVGRASAGRTHSRPDPTALIARATPEPTAPQKRTDKPAHIPHVAHRRRLASRQSKATASGAASSVRPSTLATRQEATTGELADSTGVSSTASANRDTTEQSAATASTKHHARITEPVSTNSVNNQPTHSEATSRGTNVETPQPATGQPATTAQQQRRHPEMSPVSTAGGWPFVSTQPVSKPEIATADYRPAVEPGRVGARPPVPTERETDTAGRPTADSHIGRFPATANRNRRPEPTVGSKRHTSSTVGGRIPRGQSTKPPLQRAIANRTTISSADSRQRRLTASSDDRRTKRTQATAETGGGSRHRPAVWPTANRKQTIPLAELATREQPATAADHEQPATAASQRVDVDTASRQFATTPKSLVESGGFDGGSWSSSSHARVVPFVRTGRHGGIRTNRSLDDVGAADSTGRLSSTALTPASGMAEASSAIGDAQTTLASTERVSQQSSRAEQSQAAQSTAVRPSKPKQQPPTQQPTVASQSAVRMAGTSAATISTAPTATAGRIQRLTGETESKTAGPTEPSTATDNSRSEMIETSTEIIEPSTATNSRSETMTQPTATQRHTTEPDTQRYTPTERDVDTHSIGRLIDSSHAVDPVVNSHAVDPAVNSHTKTGDSGRAGLKNRTSDDVVAGTATEFTRSPLVTEPVGSRLSPPSAGRPPTDDNSGQSTSQSQRTADRQSKSQAIPTLEQSSTGETQHDKKAVSTDSASGRSTASTADRRPRLTVSRQPTGGEPAGAADQASESRQQSTPQDRSPGFSASRQPSRAGPRAGDNRSASTDPFGESGDDPFETVERGANQPGADRTAGTDPSGQRAKQHGSRDDSKRPERGERSPAGSLSYDADVDRLVETLYRRLERKLRIERERKGL